MKIRSIVLICASLLSSLMPTLGCSAQEKRKDQQTMTQALIDQLALSEAKASDSPIQTPSDLTPKNDRRVVAYEAAAKLSKMGRPAWKLLLRNFDDERQSVAFASETPNSVGDACFYIIKGQIEALPQDYSRSLFREGKDGKLHPRPGQAGNELLNKKIIAKWLQDRADKSLSQIQTEVLRWYIRQEKLIGFSNDDETKEYLTPLERTLQNLETLDTGTPKKSSGP